MTVVEIPLTRGFVALVDAEDAPDVLAAGKWHVLNDRYAMRHFPGGRATAMHTFLTGWPLVDHINGDGLDNRRANLRQATHAENMRNRRRAISNRSGYKGVYWVRDRRKWKAQIKAGGRKYELGRFSDASDAARAYNEAAVRLHGEFAALNIIDD